jgi:hypothetical protein
MDIMWFFEEVEEQGEKIKQGSMRIKNTGIYEVEIRTFSGRKFLCEFATRTDAKKQFKEIEKRI